MMIDMNTLMPLAIALVGSAGLWSFLSMRSKFAHERSLKEDERSAVFNDTLKEQLDRVVAENKELHVKVEQLLEQMSEVKAELAQSKATIQHLETLLRTK